MWRGTVYCTWYVVPGDCLLFFKLQEMITLSTEEKVNGMRFVHFGLHLSESPDKHSAFHHPYEQSDLPWHSDEGGGFLFPLTQPAAAGPTPSRAQAGSSRCAAPGAWRSPPGPPRFPILSAQSHSLPPAFPVLVPGRGNSSPAAQGLPHVTTGRRGRFQ